jgi:nucleoside-diphosphate-sugar epimerase
MAKAFVTGATGFLGRHLIDVLLEAEWDITAMVRDPKAAATILDKRVTLVQGDLTKPESLRQAIPPELDCIFHAAADTSTWSREAATQEKINVGGTATLLQMMYNFDVKRMVHVSSIAAFGEHHGPITEDTPRLGAKSWISYVRTKSFAERKVKEAVERGLDATIVNPTHIVGKYDSHNWARLITMTAEESLPGVPPGAGNFANGRAVAEAILAAYHKGKPGENYILGGPQASFHEFLTIAAEKLGKPAPKKPMPKWALGLLASVLSIGSLFTGKRPMITQEEAAFSSEVIDAKSDKAVRELGYRIVPLEQSIDESIAFLKGEGLI